MDEVRSGATEPRGVLPPECYRTDRLEDDSWRADPELKNPGQVCCVEAVIATRCCGWSFRPTRVQVIEAVRGRNRGDARQLVCADVVALESEPEDLRRMLNAGLFSAADAAWWMQPGAALDVERAKVLSEWLLPEKTPNA